MKVFIIIVVAGLLSFNASAQFSKARLQATGLTCAMCSNAINKALKNQTFIESVKADIKNSAFDIVFKENVAFDIDQIKDAVEDAGFGVGSLKLTGNFEKLAIENDKHVLLNGKNFHFLNVSPQTLDGERTITIVDHNFLTSKEFKKISASTKMDCVKTGKASTCCTGVAANSRIYHVTI